jgi:hypothetical protein
VIFIAETSQSTPSSDARFLKHSFSPAAGIEMLRLCLRDRKEVNDLIVFDCFSLKGINQGKSDSGVLKVWK